MAGKRFLGSRNLSLYVGRSATKYHPDRSLEEGVVTDGPRHLLEILHESTGNSSLYARASTEVRIHAMLT